MITGIIGRKMGMTHVFSPTGGLEAVTAIEAGPCFVTQIKTKEQDGYDAVQLGLDEVKRLNSPLKGHLKGAGRLLRHLREFKTDDLSSTQVGQKVDASLFQTGELVDVVGISKGKGFAGTVKRHHFRGGPKSHGQSDRHRAPGSVGGTSPGRVYKGKRMAGHMGNQRATVRHIQVVLSDPARNLVLIHGTAPGPRNGLVLLNKVRTKER